MRQTHCRRRTRLTRRDPQGHNGVRFHSRLRDPHRLLRRQQPRLRRRLLDHRAPHRVHEGLADERRDQAAVQRRRRDLVERLSGEGVAHGGRLLPRLRGLPVHRDLHGRAQDRRDALRTRALRCERDGHRDELPARDERLRRHHHEGHALARRVRNPLCALGLAPGAQVRQPLLLPRDDPRALLGRGRIPTLRAVRGRDLALLASVLVPQ